MKSFKKSIFAVLMAAILLVSVFPVFAAEEKEESFITSIHFGTERANFPGFVGMIVEIGDQPLTVTSLGRVFLKGNSATHTLKIVDQATGADVASTTVNMADGDSGDGFTYAKLSTPVTLEANKTYYFLTEEVPDGDAWCDYDTCLDTTAAAACTGYVFYLDGVYNHGYLQGCPFGPMNFLYEKVELPQEKTPAEGEETAAVLLSQLGATLRNDFEGWVGTKITVGAADITVTSLGRVYIKGNSLVHAVKLVNAETGNDVPGSTAYIDMTAASETVDNGKFAYGKLENPIVLEAGKSYYLVTRESTDKDLWYDGDSRIITTEDITCDGLTYLDYFTEAENPQWIYIEASGAVFGPVDMTYIVAKPEETPVPEETPQATELPAENSEALSETETGGGLPLWSVILIISGGVILVAVIVILLVKKKK